MSISLLCSIELGSESEYSGEEEEEEEEDLEEASGSGLYKFYLFPFSQNRKN